MDEQGIQFYFDRGVKYLKQEEYQKAIKAFTVIINAVEATDEQKAGAYRNRGVTYEKQGNYEEAIADFTQAIDLATDNNIKASAYESRGTTYNKQREYELAIADFTQAIDLATDNNIKAKAHGGRGITYGEQGKSAEAINDFTQAIELFKDKNNKAKTYYNRGLTYNKQGKYEPAIKDFTQATELYKADNDKANAYNDRGNAYNKQGKYAEAIDDYEKAIELATDNETKASAYLGWGVAYDEQGKYEPAIADYTQAIELSTDKNIQAKAYCNRGNTYYEIIEYDKAIDDYTKAIELQANCAEAYWGKGNTYAIMQQHKKIKQDFKEAKKNFQQAKLDFQKAINIQCQKAKDTSKTIIGYKFQPINKNTISLLVQRQVYFSDIASLNDPLECPLLHYDNSYKEIFRYKEIFQGELEPRIFSLSVPLAKHKRNELGICTDIVNNTLLFSHYADSHKGICIEYQLDREFLEQGQILYTPVQYSEDTQANSLENMFAIKDTKWRYEHEGRFIAFGRQKDSSLPPGIYAGAKIRKIIFGRKTPDKDKQLIYKLLQGKTENDSEKIEFFETTSKAETFFDLKFKVYNPTTQQEQP